MGIGSPFRQTAEESKAIADQLIEQIQQLSDSHGAQQVLLALISYYRKKAEHGNSVAQIGYFALCEAFGKIDPEVFDILNFSRRLKQMKEKGWVDK